MPARHPALRVVQHPEIGCAAQVGRTGGGRPRRRSRQGAAPPQLLRQQQQIPLRRRRKICRRHRPDRRRQRLHQRRIAGAAGRSDGCRDYGCLRSRPAGKARLNIRRRGWRRDWNRRRRIPGYSALAPAGFPAANGRQDGRRGQDHAAIVAGIALAAAARRQPQQQRQRRRQPDYRRPHRVIRSPLFYWFPSCTTGSVL